MREQLMESADFTAMALDTGAPLQQQLYQQLVDWICSGRLPAGCKLLSSRRLAQDVGVSRNTVILNFGHLRIIGQALADIDT
ncbi:MAG: GntR family transcriptional regulator, partial [Pseudomonadota bacterium]